MSKINQVSKEVGNEVPSNIIEGTSEEQKDFVRKSTSFFIEIPNKNMKNIDRYIKYLKLMGNVKYMLVGKHDGPQLEHYHIYCQYTSTRTLHSKDLDFSCIDPNKIKSPKAILAYIKAEDKKHRELNVQSDIYYEEGEPPHQGGKSLKELMKLNLEERKNLPPCQLLSLYKCEEKIKQVEAIDEWLKIQNVKVEWFWGPTRCGKTYHAKMIGQKYRQEGKMVLIIKYDKNGFAHTIGTDEAELVILNEWRDSCMKYTDFLEILVNEHQYNIKGGSEFLPNLKHVIITSQQHPKEIYPNVKEDHEQIYQRITGVYDHRKINGEYVVNQIDISKPFESLAHNNNDVPCAMRLMDTPF